MKKTVFILLIALTITNYLFAQLTFEEIYTLPAPAVSSNANIFGDIDNDGDQDVIISGHQQNDELFVGKFINDGSGNFTQVGTVLPVSFDGDAELADVDGDGDLDYFVVSCYYSNISTDTLSKLFLNDGSGNFSEVTGTNFATFTVGGHSGLFDLNNDGALDLILTGWQGESNKTAVYFNDGNGNFTEHEGHGIEDMGYTTYDFADVDNDGDLDLLICGLVVGSGFPTSVGNLYLNDGNGNFTVSENIDLIIMMGGEENSIQFADFDGDGDQDVMVAGVTDAGNVTYLYINDGNGNFERVDPNIAGIGDGEMDVADVDNDGDIDLLITGIIVADYPPNLVSVSTIYLNDGNANFTMALSQNYFKYVYFGCSIDFVDIDNDGKLDVYLSGAQKLGPGEWIAVSGLYKNTTLTNILENNSREVTVYPNPVQDNVYIDSPEPISKIEIYSMDGRIVGKQENATSSTVVNMQDLSAGVYYMNIETKKKVITKKVIRR